MPNEKQPQEFETFQLLFDKNLPTSENSIRPFKSFIDREQSFVNQISDYMHAPGKNGFFTHMFLGNAVALLSTELNKKEINAEKIYYRFDGAKTLKLVVATSKDGKEIDHIYPFIFTEDIKEHYEGQRHTEKFKFTKNEIDSIIESISKEYKCVPIKILDRNENKFTIVEIINNNYVLKIQDNNPNKVKPKEIYIYKKDNKLFFEAKNICNIEIKEEISIGKERDKLNIDILNFEARMKDKKTRGILKFKIKSFLSKKGYHCKKNIDDQQEPQSLDGDGFSSTGSNRTVSLHKENIVINGGPPKDFNPILTKMERYEEEMVNRLVKYEYLEDYIAKLHSVSEVRIEKIFKKILSYIQQAHSGLEISENAYGKGAREANQHAFLVGVFQMDRYRDNTRIFIEQLAGRGLADTILLPLGATRVSDSIPILIEHKIGEEKENTPGSALDQTKEYAKGLQTNRIRFLTTTAQNYLCCVGINLDYKLDLIKELFEIIESGRGRLETRKGKAKNTIDKHLNRDDLIPLKDHLDKIINNYNVNEEKNINNKMETKEKILGVLTFNSEVVSRGIHKIVPIIEGILNNINKLKDLHETQKHIKEQLERSYYSFPGTRSGQSNHCLSRFLLGYSSIINNSEYKKYVFIYDEKEENIIKTDTRPKKYNLEKIKDESHAVTTVVFIPQEADGKVVIMNFVEGEEKAHEQFKTKRVAKNTLEMLMDDSKKLVEINLFFDIIKKGSKYKFIDFFKGFKNKKEIVEHKNLNKYINYHKNNTNFDGKFSEEISVPKYFDKEIRKLLSTPSTYRDFFKEIGKIIYPFKELIKNEYDFQAVLDGIFGAYSDKKPNESVVLTEYQTGLGNRIDMIIHQKGNPIIGLELKIIEEASKAGEMLKAAEEQIKEKYKKSVTYKVLDDVIINKTEFISVVFIRNASSAEELIKCSENTIPVEIKRSSVAIISQGCDNSPPALFQAQGNKRILESSDKTQSDPKRPASAGDKEKPERMEFSTTSQQQTQEPMDTEQEVVTLTQDLAASNIESQPSTSGGGKSGKPIPYSPVDESMLFQGV